MRFFSTVLAGAAFVSAALAVSITDFPATAEAGKSYTVKYDPANDTPTTLILRKGDSNNLANVSTLTTSATGGSYQWTVDKGLASGNDYALMIIQAGAANYIGPIAVTGGTGSASSSMSSMASSTSMSMSMSTSTSKSMSTTASAATASSSANSTVSAATLSASKTGASASATASGSETASGSGAPQSTGGASQMGSSMALIFGAVAAMAYLN